jgi:hypothetical protein
MAKFSCVVVPIPPTLGCSTNVAFACVAERANESADKCTEARCTASCPLTRAVWMTPYPTSTFRPREPRRYRIRLRGRTLTVSHSLPPPFFCCGVDLGAALLGIMDDLERYVADDGDEAGVGAVRECRAALEKLVGRMDSLEAGFDKIAERSCMLCSSLCFRFGLMLSLYSAFELAAVVVEEEMCVLAIPPLFFFVRFAQLVGSDGSGRASFPRAR